MRIEGSGAELGRRRLDSAVLSSSVFASGSELYVYTHSTGKSKL